MLMQVLQNNETLSLVTVRQNQITGAQKLLETGKELKNKEKRFCDRRV